MSPDSATNQLLIPARQNKKPGGPISPIPDGDSHYTSSFKEQINQAIYTQHGTEDRPTAEVKQNQQTPEDEKGIETGKSIQGLEEKQGPLVEQNQQTPEDETTVSMISTPPQLVPPTQLASNEFNQIVGEPTLEINALTTVAIDHGRPHVPDQIKSADFVAQPPLEDGASLPMPAIKMAANHPSPESIPTRTEVVTALDSGQRGRPIMDETLPAEVDRIASEPRHIPNAPQAELTPAANQKPTAPDIQRAATPPTVQPQSGESAPVKSAELDVMAQFDPSSSQSDGQERPAYPPPKPSIEYSPQESRVGGRETVTPGGSSAVSDQGPTIRPQLFNQVVRQVQFSLQQGQGETIIRLKPDHLGMMQVQVAIENKMVKTHIVVESEETRRLIEASMPSLRQSLSDQGLRVDQLDVEADKDAFETFQQRQDQSSTTLKQPEWSNVTNR